MRVELKSFSIAMHWHVLWLRLDIYRQKNTTLEEIMCDPKKHEVAEKNKAIKEDAEEFRKKLPEAI